MTRSVIRLYTVFLTLILALSLQTSAVQHTLAATASLPSSTDTQDKACQEILTQAMTALEQSCTGVGRNKACYANNQVKAEAVQNVSLKFDVQGDIADIKNIKTIITSPLNVEKGTWGLSLLKLQANLPDTLPGQNVTFLIYGDTQVQNASGDMHSFYFTSGLGNPDCKEAPRDSIVVKSPSHTEVTFTANGANITIASTIVLRAEKNKQMSVELVEGHAKITTAQGTTELHPGEQTEVNLGGDNGLSAVSAPSTPHQADQDSNLSPVINVAQTVSDPDAPVNISVQGCITEKQGNWVTVNDYKINVGSDQTLKDSQVGDCVDIDGTLKFSNDNAAIEFALVKAQKDNSLKDKGGQGGGASNAQNGQNGQNGQMGQNGQDNAQNGQMGNSGNNNPPQQPQQPQPPQPPSNPGGGGGMGGK